MKELTPELIDWIKEAESFIKIIDEMKEDIETYYAVSKVAGVKWTSKMNQSREKLRLLKIKVLEKQPYGNP